MTENSGKITSENIPSEAPLGNEDILLSRSPLGQTFLQPLGTRSLSVLDVSLFSGEGVELQRFPDWDSPFLVESKPRFGNESIIQEKPLSPVDNFAPSPNTESGGDRIPPPITSNPEEPQVRRELASPSEAINLDSEKANDSTLQPSISKFKPSKSTLFRSILGEKKYHHYSNTLGSQESRLKSEKSQPIHLENVQRESETSGIEEISEISSIQRQPETPASETVSDAIASSDSPSIQRQSETPASETISDAIASSDSPGIQRQSETPASETISDAIASSDSPSIQRQSETPASETISDAIASSDSPSIQRESETSPIRRQPETSTSETISDAIASSDSPPIQRESVANPNRTVREMLSDGSFPEIQRVVKTLTSDVDISAFKFGHKSFGNRFFNIPDARKDRRDEGKQKLAGVVPKSGPGLENFTTPEMGPENRQSMQQTFFRPKREYLPDSTQVSAGGKVISSQFYNKPMATRELMEKTIETRAILKDKMSPEKSHPIQPLRQQDLDELEEHISTQPSSQEPENEKKQEEKEEVVTSEHLEALAREIYGSICQRLQIERERYGLNPASRRLPW